MCLQGYAVKAGMLVARGEVVLFMDADGATKVSDVEKLEASLQSVVTGTKDSSHSLTSYLCLSCAVLIHDHIVCLCKGPDCLCSSCHTAQECLLHLL